MAGCDGRDLLRAGIRTDPLEEHPDLARALWSFAHGMVILEIDGRYPPDVRDSELDRTWEAGAVAFAGLVDGGRLGGPRSAERDPG